MTLNEFEAAVRQAEGHHPEWRYGQALFNTLYLCRPEIAEEIRATPNDPFYAYNNNDPRVHGAYKVIMDRW